MEGKVNIQLGTILHFNDYNKYQQVVDKFYKEYGETAASASTAMATGTGMGTMMATETATRNNTIKNMKTNETFKIQYRGNQWHRFQRENFNFTAIVTNIIPDGNEDFAVIEMKALSKCGEIQQGSSIYMRQYVAKGFV